MCEIKITFDTIIGLSALVVAIMAYLHSRNSSKENKRQLEQMDILIQNIFDFHKNKAEKEEQEKEEREKSLSEIDKMTQKSMNDYFKREEQRLRI